MASSEHKFEAGDIVRPTAAAVRQFPSLTRSSRGLVKPRSVRTPHGQARIAVTTFGRTGMAMHWDVDWWVLVERPKKARKR